MRKKSSGWNYQYKILAAGVAISLGSGCASSRLAGRLPIPNESASRFPAGDIFQTEKAGPRINFFSRPIGGNFVQTSQLVVGDDLSIRVSGLRPSSAYSLRVDYSTNHKLYSSQALVNSNSFGEINSQTMESKDGTFKGTDPTGLMWSLKDLNIPASSELPSALVQLFDGASLVATAPLAFAPIRDGVRVEFLNGTGLAGRLYLPATELGPRPVVIVLSGSEGGIDVTTAHFLASNGFAALALGYFNFEDRPQTAANLDLEYFERALRYVSQRSDILGSRIGIWGRSMGGEMALLMGTIAPDLKAIVVFGAGTFVIGPFIGDSTTAGPTYNGKPIPFIPLPTPVTMRMADGSLAGFQRPAIEDPAFALKAKEFRIKTEKISGGPVLLIAGADDQIFPACPLANEAYLQVRRKQPKSEYYCYPKAGHALEVPFFLTRRRVVDVPGGLPNALGGTPGDDMHASREAFRQTLNFLRENL